MYFRFSVGQQIYYFGFYFLCGGRSSGCVAPPTFITSSSCLCYEHWTDRCRQCTPTPPTPTTFVPDNTPKHIDSNKLGVSYTKELSFSKKHDQYFVVFKNFRHTSNRSHQILRFDHLTNSSSNDFKKLITQEKSRAIIPCSHLPTTSRGRY